jgi:hypothetical protein
MLQIDTLQIKIELDRIKPAIWRRFIVDTSFSLHKLHKTIQFVMGWYNAHQYEFNINNTRYSITDQNDNYLDYEIIDSKKTKLRSLGLQQNDNFKYVYDFGDDWKHTIYVEKILKIGPVAYPMCLDGDRSCPPEDCGSIPGYEELVESMKKPESQEATRVTEWLGEPYDPDFFDIRSINERLESMSSRRLKVIQK